MFGNILRKSFTIREIRKSGVIVEHLYNGPKKKVEEDINYMKELYKDRCFMSKNQKNCLVIVED